jgi:MoaA/NifB/PqqE/SkfB family radical SAM enzyme
VGFLDFWLEVTTKCNSRCITCNMWKRHTSDELSLEEIKNIFKSKCMKGTKVVYLTGGEPFLRDDLVEIVNFIFDELGCSVSFTTNGLLPQRICEMVEKMSSKPSIDISLNGREEIHDLTRGVKGSFDKAIQTYRCLQKLGLKANFLFTICPANIEDIGWVQKFCEDLGTHVNFALAMPTERIGSQDLDIYTYSTDQKKRILSQLPPSIFKEVVQRHFNNNLFFRCQYGVKMIEISSTGSVYACSHFIPELKIGEIREKNLDQIMSSGRYAEIIKSIQDCKCQPCPISLSHAINSITSGTGYLVRKKIFEILQSPKSIIKHILYSKWG